MNKTGVMIGTYLFESIEDAYGTLRYYDMLEGTCETFLVELPEKPYNYLLERTKESYPRRLSIEAYEKKINSLKDSIYKEWLNKNKDRLL